MQSLIYDTRIRRRGLFVVSFGAALCAAILLAGCSSGGNSTALERGPAPVDSLAADPQVEEIFANSCFDCHSDRAGGSFTAKFAPSYLFGAQKGREALNLSNWAAMDVKQRSAAASLIAAVVDSGSMPPGDYDFFHPSATLSDEQRKLVLQWTARQTAL